MHLIRHHPASVGTQIRQFGRGATGHRSEQDAAHSGGSARGYLGVGGTSQQSRYGLLDDRLFCIFIHRHSWGECPLSGIPKVLLVTGWEPGAGPGRGGGQHLIR